MKKLHDIVFLEYIGTFSVLLHKEVKSFGFWFVEKIISHSIM